MASLTLKGIPSELMRQLREMAKCERRSLNQQAFLILERALSGPRPSFSERQRGACPELDSGISPIVLLNLMTLTP